MTRIRTAIYARVSTRNHDQKPEVQIEELKRYCAARGFDIVSEIIDHGYTGSNDARPGLKKLMSMVRSREVDAVIVVKMDRLFRSLRHLVTTLEEFHALGVQFVATKDNVDYTTPGGRLFVQMLGALAEFEKSLLVERTMMGLDHARRSGKRLGRPRTSNPEEIRRLRASGLSYRAIRDRTGAAMSSITEATRTARKTPSQK